LADIVLVPKDGGNVIRAELWAEAERLVEAIALIEVTPNFSLLLLASSFTFNLRAEELLRLLLWIRIRIELCAGSGSKRAKMNRKNIGLKTSPVAWPSFIEAWG
jgi:hypothetical protein